eukprot:TRINITY_DN2363_c0_g1_i3.p1 TRINITY_DN2363_c0_g1~~TRINITY_DN2363_c0_g1_i3.p1  ORF type:complete len:101 (-),score=18.02 TRINITY_DN2363_c0_g1_i3:286-588(-)
MGVASAKGGHVGVVFDAANALAARLWYLQNRPDFWEEVQPNGEVEFLIRWIPRNHTQEHRDVCVPRQNAFLQELLVLLNQAGLQGLVRSRAYDEPYFPNL